MSIRRPPHVDKNIYAGLVRMEFKDPKDVVLAGTAVGIALEKHKTRGLKKALAAKKSKERKKNRAKQIDVGDL